MKIKVQITNLNEFKDSLKKLNDLSEDMKQEINKINNFKFKIKKMDANE